MCLTILLMNLLDHPINLLPLQGLDHIHLNFLFIAVLLYFVHSFSIMNGLVRSIRTGVSMVMISLLKG